MTITRRININGTLCTDVSIALTDEEMLEAANEVEDQNREEDIRERIDRYFGLDEMSDDERLYAVDDILADTGVYVLGADFVQRVLHIFYMTRDCNIAENVTINHAIETALNEESTHQRAIEKATNEA